MNATDRSDIIVGSNVLYVEATVSLDCSRSCQRT